MGVLQDEDPLGAAQRPPRRGFDQLVHLAFAVKLAFGSQDLDIGEQVAVDGQAMAAAVAGIGRLLQADQALGEIQGETQLVIGVGTGKDQAGRDPFAAQVTGQRRLDAGIANEFGKRHSLHAPSRILGENK